MGKQFAPNLEPKSLYQCLLPACPCWPIAAEMIAKGDTAILQLVA